MSLFSKHKQANQSKNIYPANPRPILSAGSLLAHEPCAELLHGLRKMSLCPSTHWDDLYGRVIAAFAEFVQGLPFPADIDSSYYRTHGLLLQGLERSYAVLQGFQASQQKNHVFSFSHKEQALWEFALLSATLLLELGHVVLSYDVEICEASNAPMSLWNAHLGTLPEQAQNEQYRLIQIKSFEPTELLSRKLTPLLARRLLPSHTFAWLAADPVILEAWLFLLMREPTGLRGPAQSLWVHNDALQKAILDAVEFLRLEEKLRLLPETEEETANIAQNLSLEEKERTQKSDYNFQLFNEKDDVTAGVAFLTWLQEGLRNGRFSQKSPESQMHLSEDGLTLIYPEIFQDFCKAYPRHKEWTVVFRQFNALGLSRLSGGDKVFERFFGMTAEEMSKKTGIPEKELLDKKMLIVPDIKAIMEPGHHLLHPFKLPVQEAAQIYPSADPNAPDLTPKPPSLTSP